MHVFRGLIHFQSLFDFSAMNDGTRKSCSAVCQAKKTRILLFWRNKFRDNAGDVLIDTVDEQTADLYACYLQAPSQVSSNKAPMSVKKL